MPKGRESKIEKAARLHMLRRGGFFAKSVSPGNRGWPDRNPSHAFCGPFYMEFKREGEVSTDEQMDMAEEMAKYGYRVYASVNSVRKAIEIIDDEIDGVPPSQRRHHPVRPKNVSS